MIDEPFADEREERVDAAIAAYLEAADAGRPLRREDFLSTYPDLAPELELFLADNEQVGRMTRSLRTPVQSHANLDETADLQVEAKSGGDWTRPGAVGPYQLGRLLGEGGMARVYEGTDAQGRRVAVKLIAPQFAESPTTLERFRQEGRLASRINHPRCVFVFTADHEAGQPYIVMELMPGPTLKEYVERRGPLNPVDAIGKIMDVVDGLEQAHKLGMIHRDVKPGNCYLDGDGRVKIGDFGLSRSLARGNDLTQSGTFVGTPLFASPEQLRGEKVDPRTDVYSTAATLYFLLTGQPPFGHVNGPALIAHVVSEPPPPPRSLTSDVPPALEQVVMRGLERHRERRYQSMREFREALAAAMPNAWVPAGLGLRIGAYAIDSALFLVIAQPLLTFFFTSPAHHFWAFMILEWAGICYFGLSEGLWGCSLGKRLLRLRVARAHGTNPVGLVRGCWRSLVFALTSGAPVMTYLYLFVPQEEYLIWGGANLVGIGTGLMARFATARRRNGYRCLHEVLSGTRVVQLPSPAVDAALPVAFDHAIVPALPPSFALPKTLGDFRLGDVLASGEGACLVRAEDERLPRMAWVWIRPKDRPALSAARCDLPRAERLRWLTNGTCNGLRWDAFVAPVGAGLRQVVQKQGRIPWPVLSRMLAGLTAELRAAEGDGTLPDVLAVDQIWVHANGQVQLLDAWPTATLERNALHPLDLVRDVVEASGYAPERGRVRLVAPLAARRCLLRLLGQGKSYARLSELSDDLACCRERPMATTTTLRVQQIAILGVLVGMALMMLFFWSRAAALGRVVALDVMTARAKVLEQVLRDESMRSRFAATLSLEEAAAIQDGWASDVDRVNGWVARQEELRVVLERRLGYVEKIGLAEFRKHYAVTAGAYQVEIARHGPFAVHVREFHPLPGQPADLSSGDLARVLASARLGEDLFGDEGAGRVFLVVVVFLSILPLLWVLWSLVWPGGLSFRLAGLALVNEWGEPCARLRSGWRALLIWLPVAGLLAWLTAIDCFFPAWSWLALVVQGLYVALLVAYGVMPLRFPERGLHDWLAGTRVVPR